MKKIVNHLEESKRTSKRLRKKGSSYKVARSNKEMPAEVKVDSSSLSNILNHF